MSVFAEAAHEAATSARVATAEQLLDVACVEAVGILRLGVRWDDPHAYADAARVIGRAQYSASRILGSIDGQVAS